MKADTTAAGDRARRLAGERTRERASMNDEPPAGRPGGGETVSHRVIR
jgi:hypothetical protein